MASMERNGGGGEGSGTGLRFTPEIQEAQTPKLASFFVLFGPASLVSCSAQVS
jgi:hypothetical protein